MQHYGYRYDYRARSAGRHAPIPAFSRWLEVIAEKLLLLFDGHRPHRPDRPDQCIVNEYRPGQGIGMHADHASFGPIVVSVSLSTVWHMHFRPRRARSHARYALPSDELGELPRRSDLVLSGNARSACCLARSFGADRLDNPLILFSLQGSGCC